MDKPVLKIIGQDSNAFVLLGIAKTTYRKNIEYFNKKEITWEQIRDKAMSSTYDNLLVTLMEYFDVC